MQTASLVPFVPFVLFALVAGCGGSTPPPDTNVDVDHELDVLFTCSQDEITAIGLTLDRVDTTLRRVQSAWVPLPDDPTARGRVVVEVFADRYHGPGLTARSQRQRWQGPVDAMQDDARILVGRHDDDTPGWRSQPRSDDDTQRERELVSAVRDCWADSRD